MSGKINGAKLSKMQARQAAKVANYNLRNSLKQDEKAQGMLNLGEDLPYCMRSKFAADTAGGMGPAGYVLLASGILILAGIGAGSYLIVKDKDAKLTEKDKIIREQKTEIDNKTAQIAPEQKYIAKEGKLLDAKGVETPLSKADKKHFFTDKQMQKDYVKAGSPALKLNDNRSVDGEIANIEDGGSISEIVKNSISSVQFLREVMPELVPDKRTNFGVYPELKDGDTKMTYKLDGGMKDALKKDLKIDVQGADTFVFGYDEQNLSEVAYFANEADGAVQPVPLVFSTEKVLDYLPDADTDVNKAMHDLKDTLYERAAVKALQTADANLKGHLREIGFADNTSISEVNDKIKEYMSVFNDTKDVLAKYENGGYGKIGDMVRDLEMVKENHTKLLNGMTDDQFAGWLQGLRENASAFQRLLVKLNDTDNPALMEKITTLQMFNDTYHRILRDYNVGNDTQLRDMITKLNDTNNTYTKLLEQYAGEGVSDDKGLMGYISNLTGKIANITKQLYQIGAPFTVENITADANGTAALRLMLKQADRAGLPVYRIDLTNESQNAIARKAFGEDKVNLWGTEKMTEVYLIDGLDQKIGEDDYAATASFLDADGLAYTEKVRSSTWMKAKDILKPLEVDEY